MQENASEKIYQFSASDTEEERMILETMQKRDQENMFQQILISISQTNQNEAKQSRNSKTDWRLYSYEAMKKFQKVEPNDRSPCSYQVNVPQRGRFQTISNSKPKDHQEIFDVPLYKPERKLPQPPLITHTKARVSQHPVQQTPLKSISKHKPPTGKKCQIYKSPRFADQKIEKDERNYYLESLYPPNKGAWADGPRFQDDFEFRQWELQGRPKK